MLTWYERNEVKNFPFPGVHTEQRISRNGLGSSCHLSVLRNLCLFLYFKNNFSSLTNIFVTKILQHSWNNLKWSLSSIFKHTQVTPGWPSYGTSLSQSASRSPVLVPFELLPPSLKHRSPGDVYRIHKQGKPHLPDLRYCHKSPSWQISGRDFPKQSSRNPYQNIISIATFKFSPENLYQNSIIHLFYLATKQAVSQKKLRSSLFCALRSTTSIILAKKGGSARPI